jgi:hypothetical protein
MKKLFGLIVIFLMMNINSSKALIIIRMSDGGCDGLFDLVARTDNGLGTICVLCKNPGTNNCPMYPTENGNDNYNVRLLEIALNEICGGVKSSGKITDGEYIVTWKNFIVDNNNSSPTDVVNNNLVPNNKIGECEIIIEKVKTN